MLCRKLGWICAPVVFVLGCGDDGNTPGLTSSPGPTGSPTSIGSATTSDIPTTSSASDSMGNTTQDSGASDSVGQTTSTTEPSETTGSPVTATETSMPSTTSMMTTTTMDSMTSMADTTTSADTTTGDETGDPDSTTGMDETGDVPCQVQMATLTPVIPNMVMVLDKSGSMLTPWDHDANPNTPTITRWNSLYQVVDLVLTKFNESVNFGANLFPNKSAQPTYDANACLVNMNVEVPVAPLNKAAILAAIPPANTNNIAGGTPASAGMIAALNHLKTLDPDIPRAVLLVTDGAANCKSNAVNDLDRFESYDNALHTVVFNAAQNDNIATYVVGINTLNAVSPVVVDGNPDSINPYQKLNELATQGGKPKNDPNEKFYNANNQIELNDALDTIIADAVSCVIPLDPAPDKPELTEVKIMGVVIPKVNNCANQNGWVYTNPNGPYDAIELCGTACTNLKQTGEADVNFFCVAG